MINAKLGEAKRDLANVSEDDGEEAEAIRQTMSALQEKTKQYETLKLTAKEKLKINKALAASEKLYVDEAAADKIEKKRLEVDKLHESLDALNLGEPTGEIASTMQEAESAISAVDDALGGLARNTDFAKQNRLLGEYVEKLEDAKQAVGKVKAVATARATLALVWEYKEKQRSLSMRNLEVNEKRKRKANNQGSIIVI